MRVFNTDTIIYSMNNRQTSLHCSAGLTNVGVLFDTYVRQYLIFCCLEEPEKLLFGIRGP